MIGTCTAEPFSAGCLADSYRDDAGILTVALLAVMLAVTRRLVWGL